MLVIGYHHAVRFNMLYSTPEIILKIFTSPYSGSNIQQPIATIYDNLRINFFDHFGQSFCAGFLL